MAHVLITFLGKGRRDGSGYERARYAFPGGGVRETPYFGLALLEELAAQSRPVDRLVVLGTGSSIWGALLEGRVGGETRWELGDAEQAGGVTAELLGRAAPAVAASLAAAGLAREAHLAVIPFGRDEAEQIQILHGMAQGVDEGDRVTIDVSHGFRHLPMLGLLSAFVLRSLKGAAVEGLYYAALEMRSAEGLAPVLRLDGLLRVAGWGSALEVFRHTGDYGVFASLIEVEGAAAPAARLRAAAFLEKTQQIPGAKKELKQFRKGFEREAASKPVLGLFAPELLRRTAWTLEPSHPVRQLAAAEAALEAGDYVRAATLGLESLVSAHLPPGSDPGDWTVREATRKKLNDRCQGIRDCDAKSEEGMFYQINLLRNALAHGTRAKSRFGIDAVLADEEKLRSRLEGLLGGMREMYGRPKAGQG